MRPKPAAVLDASALMAHLNDEAGAATVRKAMKAGAAISVANWAEVLSNAVMAGSDPSQLAADLLDHDPGSTPNRPICS